MAVYLADYIFQILGKKSDIESLFSWCKDKKTHSITFTDSERKSLRKDARNEIICPSSSLAAARRMNEEHALIAAYVNRLQSGPHSVDSPRREDEEHKLIARYTSRLAETDGHGVSRPHRVFYCTRYAEYTYAKDTQAALKRPFKTLSLMSDQPTVSRLK